MADLTAVGVEFPFCIFFSLSLQYHGYSSLFKKFFYGASVCFTVSHNQGLFLAGPPRIKIHLLVLYIKCIKAYFLETGCLSDDQIGDRK